MTFNSASPSIPEFESRDLCNFLRLDGSRFHQTHSWFPVEISIHEGLRKGGVKRKKFGLKLVPRLMSLRLACIKRMSGVFVRDYISRDKSISFESDLDLGSGF